MNAVAKTGIAALALALFAVTPRAHAQEGGEDTIVKRDNAKLMGTIKSEDVSGCRITLSGGGKAELAVTWNQVKSIDYGGSGDFRQAKRFTDAGDTRGAIPLLDKLHKDAQLRDILKPHVLNLLGLNYFREAAFDKALEAYNELFTKYPKTQLIASGGKNLVNCYLAKNDAAGADSALQKLVSSGVDTAQLGLLKAQVAEAKKDWPGALSGYKAVLSAAGTDDAAKAEAELGIGRCLLGQNKAAEAESQFRGLISKEGASNYVLAGAWNGIADVTFRAGFEKKDPETLINAVYQYLRGCVQYTPQSGEPTGEYEHAIWGASRAFDAISQLETKEPAKKTYAQRARERLEFLQTKFPSSTYLALK